jgi:cellulose synthase/poly-beta-1,6-N-acetylglucosamine synthase-like glycosyltransferase
MERVSILVLAVAMVLFTAPLFLDLALCIAGNLFKARKPKGTLRRSIRLAVVVPAHDEESMIARTVKSLKVADFNTSVFVVAHNCSDATAAAAADAGAQVVELKNPKLRGKGAALRHGFAAALDAGADAFLVVDADSLVSPNLIAATREMLEQGAEATQCRYELDLQVGKPHAGTVHPLSRLRALAFRGMNVVRARGRAGLGFSTGLYGNGFALTATALELVPFDVNSIAEDVEFHTRLVQQGLPVYWIGDAFVHAHTPASSRAQATQEARWEGGRFRVASQATSRLVEAMLQGRWRAVETLLDVWSLPLSRGILALMLTLALAVQWLHVFALVCAAITVLYVVESALLGDKPVRDLAALAAAPLYLLWKALITPMVLRQSRSRAEWARTKREAPQS